MDVNLTIQAPELVGAINNLAAAFGRNPAQLSVAPAPTGPVTPPAAPAVPVAPTAPQPDQITPPGYGFPGFQQPPVSVPVAPSQAAPPAAPVAPAQPVTPTVPPAVPTAGPTSYDINQLAVAATQLMDAGLQDKLMDLLQQFGVQALTMLPKEQYGNFATALRGLGARI